MEFYEVVNKRRSIRQFEDREILREVLEQILDAGLKAPSSNHQRRWLKICFSLQLRKGWDPWYIFRSRKSRNKSKSS